MMNRLPLILCAVILSNVVAAKTPKQNASGSPRALTPPPKEWAMFPDDPTTPPATPPAQQPQKTPGTAPQVGTPAATDSANAVSVAVPAAPKRDLPLLWIALTGLLSFGALFACGGLILKKEQPAADSQPAVKMVAGIPVVEDEQEIR